MKKFLSLMLVFAIALSTLVSVAPVFAVESGTDSTTVALGTVFKPDYENGSNEYFKFGKYNGSNFLTSPVFDKVGDFSDQWWPFADGSKQPYDDFNQYYADGYTDLCVVGSAKAQIIGLYFKGWNYPTISFVAPADGTYLLDMELGRRNYTTGTGTVDSSTSRLTVYHVDASGKHTSLDNALFNNVNSVNSKFNDYSKAVTLKEGERVVLYLYDNGGNGQQFFVRNLTATLAYTPDYANGSDEYFSFGYFDKNSFSTSPVFDKVGDFSDQWWPFADGSKKPYDDFNKFINDSYTDLRVVGSAKAKIIGLYSVAGNGNNPYFSFTAPECGTYTVSMGLGVRDWSSSSGSLATNVARIETYTEKPGSAYKSFGEWQALHKANSATAPFNNYTFEVELEKGEKVCFYYYSNQAGLQAFIKDLAVAPSFEHKGSAEWEKTETSHKQVYSCCGETALAEDLHTYENGKCTVCQYEHVNHEGGHATCTDLKVCALCGKSYGDVLAHTPKDTYEHTSEEHWKICQDCPAIIEGSKAPHNFDNGDCVCGEPKPACDHASCTKSYPEKTEDGHIVAYSCGAVDTTYTPHTYENGKCTACEYEHVNHEGGSATCTTLKECTVCGKSYGETLPHSPKAEYGKDENEHWQICANGCNSEIADSAEPHDFTDGDCVCGQKKPIESGDVFTPENLGTSADNGCFGLGYYASGNKTNITVFDQVKTTEADNHWPFMEAFEFYNYYSSTVDTLCIAGAKNGNAIGMYNKGQGQTPAILFTAPASGVYRFSMGLSGCVYGSEAVPGALRAYVDGSDSPRASSEFGRGANGNITFKSFEVVVYLEEGEHLSLVIDQAPARPYVVKDLSATLLSLCDECDHTGGRIVYSDITADTHVATYSCCGTVIAGDSEHNFDHGNCACGQPKPIEEISVGDIVKPENLGNTAYNGLFGLGYYAGGDKTNITVFDQVKTTEADNFWPFGELMSFYAYYNSSYDGRCIAGVKGSNVIGFYNQDNSHIPAILFTVPTTGTYKFTMDLSACVYNATEELPGRFNVYVAGNETPIASSEFGRGANGNISYESFTFTVYLEKGAVMSLVFENATTRPYIVKDLSAKLLSLSDGCDHTGETTTGKSSSQHWKECADCGKEVEGSRVNHKFSKGKCTTCGQVKIGTTYKPTNLGVNANNGMFKLGYYAGGAKTNIVVFDKVKTTEADNHWPFMDAFEFYNYYSSTVDTLCIAGAKNTNAIGMYNKGQGQTPAILFTAPSTGTYKFTMDLSGCVYDNTSPLAGVLNVYVEGSDTPYKSSEFGRGANGNIDYKNFTFYVYLEEGQDLSLILENTPARPYVIKGLTAKYVSASPTTGDTTVSAAMLVIALCGLGITFAVSKKRKHK